MRLTNLLHINAFQMCIALNVDVSFFHLIQLLFSKSFIYARRNFSARATKVGILYVGSNFGLNVGREEVALNSRDASRRLSRYQVYSYDSSPWVRLVHRDLGLSVVEDFLRSVGANLGPRAWSKALERNK